MSIVNIKVKCSRCEGTGKDKQCNCKSIGRYGAWECARGYCGGTEVECECWWCDGKGYTIEEAELAD